MTSEASGCGDLAGKTILITGGTAGIGLVAARRLAARGADLALVGRDSGRLAAAVSAVRAEGGGPVTGLRADLSSLAEVRALAAEARQRFPRLHVLVNNAGGVTDRRLLTPDGFERTFAANHLGHFLLTHLLQDRLRAAAPSRVVVVASRAHRRARLDFDDLQVEREWTVMRAYSRSKLANVLFAAELARRLRGSGVAVNSLHPGVVATDIWNGAGGWTRPLLGLAKWFMLTPEQGAEPIVHLAASPEMEGRTGGYYDRTRLAEPSRWAGDESLARRLWEVSERLTGLAPGPGSG